MFDTTDNPTVICGGKTVVLERPIIPEPEVCPVCGAPATHWRRNKEVKDVYCSKPATCPAAALCRIDGYIGDSKRGVGILGIGDSVLAALTDSEDGEAPLVSSPADLYRLTAEQISPLTIGYSNTNSPIRLGDTRAKAIIEQINKARKVPLAKFLGSLNIDLLGRRRVEQLAVNPALTTIEGWLDEGNLLSIPGDTIRKSIIDGMNQKRPLILELLLFVTVEPIAAPVAVADGTELPLASLSFCFTGTRECLDEVKKRGGEIKSGVSSGLTYLVQGKPDSISNKTQKAESLGIKIISITTLRRALAGEIELP